jgi:hypothetical protein
MCVCVGGWVGGWGVGGQRGREGEGGREGGREGETVRMPTFGIVPENYIEDGVLAACTYAYPHVL